MNTGIGAFISQRRDELGVTQTAFAERIGLKRSHLSLIESGKIALPSADVRRRIADALNVRHVDLLVIAGELSLDEIDPRRQPVHSDPRLQTIADTWPDLTDKEREFLLHIVNASILRRSVTDRDDDLGMVTGPSGGHRSTG